MVKGFIIKSKNDVEEQFQGPQIVVNGKTITTEWFKQYPTYYKLFTGMFFADHLTRARRLLPDERTDIVLLAVGGPLECRSYRMGGHFQFGPLRFLSGCWDHHSLRGLTPFQ